MATCLHEVGTADTGVTANTSGAFTPAAGDLLVVFAIISDTVSTDGVLSSSAGTLFTQFARAACRASADRMYGWVANSFSAASSQTVTVTPGDAGTGSIIFVCAVSGMLRVGAEAVRQFAIQEDQAAATPAPVFPQAVLTANPTLGFIGNATTTAATMTPPSGWTEPATGDLGYATPTTGGAYCFRDSGFTGTTVTWGSASSSAFGSMIVELDTSIAGVPALVMAPPRVSSRAL